MKTVLSNAKKYLSILLAAAMVVLSVPNAPVTLLAATVDETSTEAEVSTETAEATETVENADTTETASEEAASAAEETTPAAEEAAPAVEEAVDAEEAPVASESAVGGEEEPEESNAAVGYEATENGYVLANLYETLDGGNVSDNSIYLASGNTAQVIASLSSSLNSREDFAAIGDTITWKSNATGVVTVESATTTTPYNNITAVAPGTAQITATWSDSRNKAEVNTETTVALDVTVAAVEISANSGTKSEDGIITLDLVTVSANVPNEKDADKLQEAITFQVVTANNTAVKVTYANDVSWNVTQNVTVSEDQHTGVVTYNSTGVENTFTASENDGWADYEVIYNPNDLGSGDHNGFIVDKGTVFVDNKTVQVILTDESGKTLTDNGGSFTSISGAQLSNKITLDQGDSANYTLSTKDETGAAPTWVTGYMVSFNGEDPINVQRSGSTLKISADKNGSVGDYPFKVYALGNTNHVSDRLVGIISGTVTVEASDSFGFVSANANEKTTQLEETEKTAFLSRVTANETGGYNKSDDNDNNSFNKVTLYTQISNNQKVTWNPLEVKNSITSNVVTGNLTLTDPQDIAKVTQNAMVREYKIVTDNDETVFGPQTVTSSIETSGGKVMSDSFTLNVIGVAGALNGGEAAELDISNNNPDNENEYYITLGILAKDYDVSDNNITDNVVVSPVEDYAVVSPNGVPTIIYGQQKEYQGEIVTNNIDYSEYATLSILGPTGGTTELSEAENITANGIYSIKLITDNQVTDNYEVIETDGLNIYAVAPGTARVNVIYADGAGNEWSTPVNVIVKDMKDALEDYKVKLEIKPETIMVGGEANLTTTATTVTDNIDVPATVTYDVTSVTSNGKATKLTDEWEALVSFNGENKLQIIDPDGLIKETTEFGITATARANYGKTTVTRTSEEATVKVLPATAVDLDFDDEKGAKQFLFVGSSYDNDIKFEGDGGLGITLDGSEHDTNVVTAEVSGNTEVVLTPVSAGTTTVTVGVPGTTSTASMAVTVYDVKAVGDAALGVSDNGERLLTYQKIGKNTPSSTLTVYTISENGEEYLPEVEWSKAGVGDGFDVTTSDSATIKMNTSGTNYGGYITATLTNRDDKRTDKVAEVNLEANEILVTIEPSDTDKLVKTITAETAEGASDWTLTPKVTFTSEGKEIPAPVDYTVTCNLSDSKVVDVTMDDSGVFTFSPKKLGTVKASLKVLSGSDVLDEANNTVEVNVAAKKPFVSDNGTDKAVTDNDALTASPIYMFKNYAVTGVDEDGYATSEIYDPTMEQATLFNVKGMKFNTGWSWGDNAKVPVANIGSTMTTKVPAVYMIDGVVVATKDVTVNAAAWDGINLSGDEVKATGVDGRYEAKLQTAKNFNQVTITNTYTEPGGSDLSNNTGFRALYEAYMKPDVTVDNTTSVQANSVKASSINLATTSTAGTALVTVKAGKYTAYLNVATADKDDMVSMNFASSNAGKAENIDPNYAFAAGATKVKADGTFFIDYDHYIGTPAHIYLAVTQNGSENPLETDSSGAGIINISSTDSAVATVSKTTMTRTHVAASGAPYDVYEAVVEPKGLGKTTIVIEASDAVATTLRTTLFVVGDAANVTVDDVTLSNVKRGTSYVTEDLNFNFPSNLFFDSGSVTSNENGYVADEINIAAGNEDGYFTIATGNGEPTIVIASGKTVEPGVYTLKLSGNAVLKYADASDATQSTQPVSFRDKELNVTVTDVASLVADDVPATVTQNDAVELTAAFNTSGYTVDSIAFTDAAAASAAGLTINNNTLFASATAELGVQSFPITIEGHKTTDATVLAYANANLNVTVLTKGDVAVEIDPVTVVRGGETALSATWMDGKTRTNTITLAKEEDGFKIENNTLKVDSDVATGTFNLQMTVEGKASDGDDAKATITVAVVVTDIEFTAAIKDFSIKRGGSTVMKTSSITDGFTAYAFTPVGDYTGLVMSDDGVTITALEGAKDSYTLDFIVNAKRNSDSAEVSTTVKNVTITVKDSGGNEPAPSDDDPVSIPNPAKEYKAVQVNSLNLLDVNDYAVVYFIGQNTNADPASVKIVEGGEYYELCDISEDRAALTNGYGAVGIRLKSDKRTDADAKAAAKAKKLTLEVNCLNADPESTPATVKLTLKNTYKIPSYTLNNASAKTYAEFVPEGGTANFFPSDKTGKMSLESGEWESVYMDSKKTTVDEDVNVEASGYGFTIAVDKDKLADKSGFIRLHNENWVDGAYTYVKWGLKLQNKVNVSLTSAVNLNNNYTTSAYAQVSLGVDGIDLPEDDTHTVVLDTTGLPEGLTAANDIYPYSIVVSIDKDANVKKGNYKVPVTISGFTNNPVKKTLTVKVTDTTYDASKAAKMVKITQKGKIDGATGLGQIFLGVNMANFYKNYQGAAYITDISFGESSGYQFVSDESSVVVTNENWKYVKGGTTETLTFKVADIDGTELDSFSVSFKIVPTVGTFKATAENRTIDTTADTYDPEAGITTPLMVTNTYKYFTSATTSEDRVYMYDMTDETASKDLKVTVNGGTQVNATYENGIIKMVPSSAEVAKIKANKSKTFNVKVTVENTVTGKKANYTVKLTVQK